MARSAWNGVLELTRDRQIRAGSNEELCAALRRGADLRVYTEFLFEEHIVPGPASPREQAGLIREVIDFRQTVYLHPGHAAGITTLRQPIHPPFGFNGSQPMMSFFLYNQCGSQACANLWLDATPALAVPGNTEVIPSPAEMPKMSAMHVFDPGTTGPSRNFVYDMETYRFFVRDDWEEILAQDADGFVQRGSLDAVEEAQRQAREIKVGISGLGLALGNGPEHEVFTLVGSSFFHTGPRIYCALTHPLVRVRPAIPLQYGPQNWDIVWLFVRTNGPAWIRRLDPHTRQWSDHQERLPLRWFAR